MTFLLAIANADAGTADEEAIGSVVAALHEFEVELVTTSSPQDLATALDMHPKVGIVVVLGGDGSLHAVVDALRSAGRLADTVIGLVPLGTGNDLARTLDIPLDPADAARTLLESEPRPLDLLVDDVGGIVVNVVHLGVGAEAAERAAALRSGIGKAAYAVGGVLAGATATGWNLRVVVDGSKLELAGPALMVAVANGRTIGGGAELAPGAEPDDGWLDVVVATSTGPLARLGFGVAMRDGDHVDRDDVVVVRGREVMVSGEPFPLNADGELQEPVPSRRWTVEPGAWSVLAPVRPATSSDGSG